MFSKETVQYFGLWAEETSPLRNRAEAIRLLWERVQLCDEEDIRTPDTRRILDYLAKETTKPILADRFWRTLEITDPGERRYAATVALDVIRRSMGL